MNIKNSILAFTLVSVVAIGPIMAMTEEARTLLQEYKTTQQRLEDAQGLFEDIQPYHFYIINLRATLDGEKLSTGARNRTEQELATAEYSYPDAAEGYEKAKRKYESAKQDYERAKQKYKNVWQEGYPTLQPLSVPHSPDPFSQQFWHSSYRSTHPKY